MTQDALIVSAFIYGGVAFVIGMENGITFGKKMSVPAIVVYALAWPLWFLLRLPDAVREAWRKISYDDKKKG